MWQVPDSPQHAPFALTPTVLTGCQGQAFTSPLHLTHKLATTTAFTTTTTPMLPAIGALLCSNMQTLVLWIVLIGVAVAYAARKGSKLFGSIIGQDPTRVSRPAGYAGYAGEPLALTIDTQGEHTYASDYVQNSGQTAQLSNGGSSAETPPGTSPTTTSNPRIKAKFKAVLAVQRFKQQGEKLRKFLPCYSAVAPGEPFTISVPTCRCTLFRPSPWQIQATRAVAARRYETICR